MAHRSLPRVEHPHVDEKVPNLTLEMEHCLTPRPATLQIFWPVHCFPDAFLSGNLRLAYVCHYLPDSAKVRHADGNEASRVGPGLSLNPLKIRLLHFRRRLASLDSDPSLCCAPDFAAQELMHAVTAGSAEILKNRYKVYVGRGRVRVSTTSFRGARDAPVHGFVSSQW